MRADIAARVALAAFLAFVVPHTATIVHVGPVAVPEFAAAVDAALVVALVAVVWFMVFGPVRRAARIRQACATAPPWTVTR